MGEFKEKLSTGGELVANERDWFISYCFPGPDMRYNWTFKRISSNEIGKYISAWENNYLTYQKQKSQLPLDGTFETIGEAGMKISVGGYWDGVCIDSWHMNISSLGKINAVVRDYEYVRVRAIKIQKMIVLL